MPQAALDNLMNLALASKQIWERPSMIFTKLRLKVLLHKKFSRWIYTKF